MSPSSPPGSVVVLIHGLSGSRRWWEPTANALRRDHRVEIPELRGFGTRRRHGRFQLATAADELASELDEMGIRRAAVVGHSMGGLVAAQLAADHPERVGRLVLVAAPLVPFPWGLPRHALNFVRAAPALAPRFRRVLAADAMRTDPMNVMSAAFQVLRADLTDRWEQIVTPTLLVWGARDTIVPPRLGHVAEGRIARSRYIELAGAGHVPMWDRPQEFNRLVSAFLADADGT